MSAAGPQASRAARALAAQGGAGGKAARGPGHIPPNEGGHAQGHEGSCTRQECLKTGTAETLSKTASSAQADRPNSIIKQGCSRINPRGSHRAVGRQPQRQQQQSAWRARTPGQSCNNAAARRRARRCVSSSQTCTCTAVESTFSRAHQAQCPVHSGQAVQSKSPAPGCVGVPATHSTAPRDMCRAAEGWRTLQPPRTRTHPHRIYPKLTHTTCDSACTQLLQAPHTCASHTTHKSRCCVVVVVVHRPPTTWL